MGKGACPRSAFGHKGATGLPYFPGLPFGAPPHTYRLDGHLWPQRGKGWRPIPGHPTGDRGPKRASKGLGGIG